MSSLLKALHLGKSKHKKLPEEWGEGIKATVNDGMNFYVKYLGSTPVDQPSSESATADAIKSIIAMARMSGKKLQRITLTIKPSGVCTTDVTSGQKVMDISIYRISYCSADATYDRVVAIICTNKNETLECHAFLTAKKKVAQAAALTISQAFTIAFENWQNAKNQAPVNNGSSTNGVKSRKCLSPSHSNGSGKLNNDRDNMHNDHNENKQPSLAGGRKKKDLDTLIDLSFEEVIPQQTPPVVPVTGDHWQLHEKNDQPFDVDLDDSFSRLAQSRSAKGHTAIDHTTSSNTVTTTNNPLCDQLQFEDAFKPVTPVALSENCINANNINVLLAAPASKSTSPVKSVSSAATCASELILPTNVKPGDFDVGELNSLFNNTNTNKQEHDKFFADTDDFFSL